eukprot:15364573-Ditylum_brightwellii.AAC.1
MKDNCIKIEALVLAVTLQHASLPSGFPCPVLKGQLKSLGLDSPMLYSASLLWKIIALLDHGRANDITSKHLWCSMESHNWELSCRASMFTLHYPSFHCGTTNICYKHLWK